MSKKADETFGTDACIIHVKLLQHHDLFLQHPYETLATYTSETSESESIETYSCNMRFQRREREARGREASAARATRRLRSRDLEFIYY